MATIILGASAVMGASCDTLDPGEGSGSGQGMEKILPNITNSRYHSLIIILAIFNGSTKSCVLYLNGQMASTPPGEWMYQLLLF